MTNNDSFTILHVLEPFERDTLVSDHLQAVALTVQHVLKDLADDAQTSLWMGHPVAKGALVPAVDPVYWLTTQTMVIRVDISRAAVTEQQAQQVAGSLATALQAGGRIGSFWMLDRLSAVVPDEPAKQNLPAPWLQVVMLTLAPGAEAEFNDWYDSEHVAQIAEVSGFRGVERFIATGDDQPYVALWRMPTPQESETADWIKASQTPWTARMRRFILARKRFVVQRVTVAVSQKVG